ncbi:Fc.00g048960.m01.CDS01 [Cosmosporella sp. VM-42]
MAKEVPSTNQCSQTSHQEQDTTTSSQAYVDATSQWSEWILDSSGLHYYRARYISYEIASTLVTNSRNSIVPDGQGYYIHYEFLGIKEFPAMQYILAPAVQPSVSTPATMPVANTDRTASTTAPAQKAAQVSSTAQNGTISDRKEVRESSAAATGGYPRIIDIDTTPTGLTISFPHEKEKHAIVLDKQARKRLKAEQKVHVNPKAKVDTWLKS